MTKKGILLKMSEVFGGSGYTKTDAQGRFTISMEADSKIIIEAKGFEDISLTIDEVNNMTKVAN